MKKMLKIISILLLLFLGFGGIYGAIMLISDPSGASFGWPTELLEATPFQFNPKFFVPAMHYPSYAVGILLLITGILLTPKKQ